MIQKDGVDIFFAGSAIFDQENLRDSIIKMKDLAKKIKQCKHLIFHDKEVTIHNVRVFGDG